MPASIRAGPRRGRDRAGSPVGTDRSMASCGRHEPRVALALAVFAGEPGESALADDRVPRLDLGLGHDVRARECASLAARFAAAKERSRERYFAERACWLGVAEACDSLHE